MFNIVINLIFSFVTWREVKWIIFSVRRIIPNNYSMLYYRAKTEKINRNECVSVDDLTHWSNCITCSVCSQTEQFTVLWILFASIVLGNTSVLVALLLNKSRKSRMNYFIMHLALAGKKIHMSSTIQFTIAEFNIVRSACVWSGSKHTLQTRKFKWQLSSQSHNGQHKFQHV
jgi:hypothetical protein